MDDSPSFDNKHNQPTDLLDKEHFLTENQQIAFSSEHTHRLHSRGKRRIKIEFIPDKTRRQITFSKRKSGLFKKVAELTTLTGAQGLLLLVSESGHLYSFATRTLQPILTSVEGKALIEYCLQSKGQESEEKPGADPKSVAQQQNSDSQNVSFCPQAYSKQATGDHKSFSQAHIFNESKQEVQPLSRSSSSLDLSHATQTSFIPHNMVAPNKESTISQFGAEKKNFGTISKSESSLLPQRPLRPTPQSNVFGLERPHYSQQQESLEQSFFELPFPLPSSPKDLPPITMPSDFDFLNATPMSSTTSSSSSDEIS